ncbi:DER1-domain-containing protein, partial [Myriangium duriaei CBS 260.36]
MSVSNDIVHLFWATPPVTRYMVAATLALSVSSHVLHIIPIYSLLFWWQAVFTYRRIPQVWRLVTTFLLSGGGLSIIFDPYFMYTYGKQLETGSPRFTPPGEFLTFVIFCGSVILFLAGYLLGGSSLLGPLIMSWAYMYSVDSPEHTINFWFVKIKARYLPWAMLVITLLLSGPYGVLLEGTGIVASHMYDFLTRLWPEYGGGRNYIHAPQFIKRLFYGPADAGTRRKYGTAFQPRTGPAAGSTSPPTSGSSWTSGFTSGGSSWSNRGAG